MERQRQSLEEILGKLSRLDASWEDDHARAVIASLSSIPDGGPYQEEHIQAVLDQDFDAGRTAVRLVLDLSKDEFEADLRERLGGGGTGITRYRLDAKELLAALRELGLFDKLEALANSPVTWRDILVERLKSGRGSATKGQARGRFLEDFTESTVLEVFGERNYDKRCRFIGASGSSTEKADFAIPSRRDANILIEVKAYGATGSKQTDILGDVSRIVEQKRRDTQFLLVTDGMSWHQRSSDLEKLIEFQNRGDIGRIYTMEMHPELKQDLESLRRSYNIPGTKG